MNDAVQRLNGQLDEKFEPNSTPAEAYICEPKSAPCDETKRWRVRFLWDELRDRYSIEILFFDRRGEQKTLIIGAEERSDTNRIARELDAHDARLPNNRKDRLSFVAELIRKTPTAFVIVTTKPGFRDGAKGFVMPNYMYGSARGRYVWGDEDGRFHKIVGLLPAYEKRVLLPVGSSPELSFGILLGLAAPLPSYVAQRLKKKLLPETAVFHLVGKTTTGKTTVVRLAESVFGAPDHFDDWRSSERGEGDVPLIVELCGTGVAGW